MRRVATDRSRTQCLDDTNGTIGKVEENENEEKEHNCAARTNVVDPAANVALHVASTKQIGDERTKDDY